MPPSGFLTRVAVNFCISPESNNTWSFRSRDELPRGVVGSEREDWDKKTEATAALRGRTPEPFEKIGECSSRN